MHLTDGTTRPIYPILPIGEVPGTSWRFFYPLMPIGGACSPHTLRVCAACVAAMPWTAALRRLAWPPRTGLCLPSPL